MSARCLVTLLVAGCAAQESEIPPFATVNWTDDAPAAEMPLDELPASLAASGFGTLPKQPYEPRWKLWSDGAEKQRWIYVPGAPIDNSNADYWRFPVGTRLWKQFTRDGVLVETRYMVKYGEADDAWLFIGFDGDGTPQPDGAQNVNGTGHDIPAQKTCLGCHANVKSRVLGFSAFQLDYDGGPLNLDDAAAAGWFSSPLPDRHPHYPVPGNAQQQAVLGYFHANCGHCHNSQSPLINRPMFRLETDHCGSLAGTRTYQSTVNVSGLAYGGATIVAKPGDPDHSIIYTRMHSSDPKKKMPALGSEIPDAAAITMIRSWIANL
jgi:hypothetical protein